MFPFYTPRKYQSTFGFLVFSGGIKWEIGQKWVNIYNIILFGFLFFFKSISSDRFSIFVGYYFLVLLFGVGSVNGIVFSQMLSSLASMFSVV